MEVDDLLKPYTGAECLVKVCMVTDNIEFQIILA